MFIYSIAGPCNLSNTHFTYKLHLYILDNKTKSQIKYKIKLDRADINSHEKQLRTGWVHDLGCEILGSAEIGGLFV